jgi:hypothetical protein
MKQLFCVTAFIITCLACSQTQKTITHTEQDLLRLDSTVQRFKKEPRYGVRIKSANCNFVILINDRIVAAVRVAEKGFVMNGFYVPINYGILQPGEQEIKIKLLPPVVDRKTEIKRPTLGNAQVEVEVVVDTYIDGFPQAAEEEIVYFWKSPRAPKHIPGRKKIPYFTQPDLPYYEHRDVFEAEDVPYSITGWQNSVNLETTNTEELKKLTQEVVAKYEELRELFSNKDIDGVANQLYGSMEVEAQQLYMDEFDIEKLWKGGYLEPYKLNDYEFKPIANYKLLW